MTTPFEDRSGEEERMTRAAGIVGSATLLSRIFGFARDAVIAGLFGASLGTDAFVVAFRIPNLLRRLFAEGSLSISFVPVFTDHLTHQGEAEAFRLAASAMRTLSVLLVGVSIVGILLSPLIIKLIAPGFLDTPEKFSLTVLLTRIMFPYVFFICLVALSMGILNALGHFTAPALAPVFLNLSMIGSAFFISPLLTQPIVGLAVGVVIGGVLQLALQVPFLLKEKVYPWQQTVWIHPGLKQVGQLMLPAVFGAAVYQLNILVGMLLASLLAEGSVTYLYFADRLVQFPLGIFAIATATAVLPSLSRQASAGDCAALKETFSYALRLITYITMPSMVGLIVLRSPIVALLFERGAFDEHTTRMTASALLYYAVGLWAFSSVRIVVAAFYAMQDTKTPVKVAAISLAANALFGIMLMGPMGHNGLALATSLSSILNCLMLLVLLRRRLGRDIHHGWPVSIAKTIFATAVMGTAVWLLSGMVFCESGNRFLRLLFGLIACIGSGVLVYVISSLLTGSQEVRSIRDIILRRNPLNQ